MSSVSGLNGNLISQGLTTNAGGHPLEAFFGPYQGTSEKLRADDALSHETLNLPAAYTGRNKFLESVLDFKVRKEDTFWTSVVLPWEYTDDLSCTWDIFTFNRTMADLEPHQGVPRYVNSSSERHTDNLLRRGLAFVIEHGFYKTEKGKRHFQLNLQQISDAIHTTCYWGVLQALLSGQNYYKEWQRRYGRQVSRSNDLFQAERRRWAIIQKEENGLYILDAELKHELKREGVTPNLWIFPDKMGIYCNMVGEHQMDYHKRGPEANVNREKGDQKGSFRGLPVYEAHSFDVDFSGEPIDLMTRDQQCGEYFVMPADDGTVGVTPAAQGIFIYSADSDKFEFIKKADAVAAADRLFDSAGGASGGAFFTEAEHAAFNDNNVVKRTNGKTAYDVPATAAAAGRALKAEFDILIFRPAQTYAMSSAILMRGGNETGSTFHGHHDFLLSDDVIRKIHVGHFTYYSKSIVKRPKNYIIVENIFAQGYIGGEGTKFYDKNHGFVSEGMSGDLASNGASLIATYIPAGLSLSNCIDMSGRFAPSVMETMTQSGDVDEHYPFSSTVYHALDLGKVDMFRVTLEDEYRNRIKRVNTVCFHGMQFNTKGECTHLNTGHWSERVYPGVRKVRDGENAFMRANEYQVHMSSAAGLPRTLVAKRRVAGHTTTKP